MTGTVTASSGLKARTGPGTSYSYVGAFNYGASLTINDTQSGWYNVSGSDGWGTLSNVWVSASYVRTDGSNSTAAVAKADTTTVTSDTTTTSDTITINGTSDGDDWESYFSSYEGSEDYSANDEYYRQLAEKYLFSLGMPPIYNDTVDIRYDDDIAEDSGRVMNKTILSSGSILSICPGNCKMFPNGFSEEKDSIVEAAIGVASGNNSLIEKIRADDQGRFSGRLYKFEAQTAEYSLYLNALCRACAIMLGIGDETMPNTSTRLKFFDYSYWTIRKNYSPSSAGSETSDKSIFRKFGDALVQTASRVVSAAVDDTTFINFFLCAGETQVSESLTASVTDSPLSSIFDGISSVASTINYFTNSGFNISDTDAASAVEAITNSGSSDVISSLMNVASNFLQGGKVILPKMVEGAKYGKSVSCAMKFVSPYGDKKSVFLRCLVPICHLIAMSFPRQLSDNMYTYPFLVKCAQTGCFNIDLGIISNLTITRGGSDETSYTLDTIATEWDVSLEITPLVDELMITSTKNPVLFCKNEMLLEYLSNFCGFSMLANNLGTKADMMASFINGYFSGIPDNLANKLNDTLYNKINKYFKLSW